MGCTRGHAPEARSALRALGAAVAGSALVVAVFAATLMALPVTASALTAPAAEPTGSVEPTGTTEPTGSVEPTTVVSQVTTRSIGVTVRGRPIVLERFGSGSRHILIVGGLHGDEAGGLLGARFKAYLRSHPSAIPTDTVVDVIAYANPDGRALKRRTNARRVDLNRNFPASNWTRKHPRGTPSHGKKAASEPETRALVRLLADEKYLRVITLHSRGGFIDPDGAGSRALAKRMARAAHIRVVNLPAYNGSMGSYVPEKHRIPIVTWELSSRTLTKRVRNGLLAGLR